MKDHDKNCAFTWSRTGGKNNIWHKTLSECNKNTSTQEEVIQGSIFMNLGTAQMQVCSMLLKSAEEDADGCQPNFVQEETERQLLQEVEIYTNT